MKGGPDAEARWLAEGYWPPYAALVRQEADALSSGGVFAPLCERVQGAQGEGVCFAAFCLAVCRDRRKDSEFKAPRSPSVYCTITISYCLRIDVHTFPCFIKRLLFLFPSLAPSLSMY